MVPSRRRARPRPVGAPGRGAAGSSGRATPAPAGAARRARGGSAPAGAVASDGASAERAAASQHANDDSLGRAWHPRRHARRRAPARGPRAGRAGGGATAARCWPRTASRSAATGSSSACCRVDKVAPTPYQRDLSPTHAKRLQDVIKKHRPLRGSHRGGLAAAGRLLDAQRHHRCSALEKLKADRVPAILMPEPRWPSRSWPSTRRRRTTSRRSRWRSSACTACWPRSGRRGRGGLHLPVRGAALHHAGPALRDEQALRRRRLRAHPEARGRVPGRHVRQDAARARGARGAGARGRRRRWRKVVAQLKKRGINHPFVKNYVLARTNPALAPAQDAALLRPGLREAAGEHRPTSTSAKVRYDEIRSAAAIAGLASTEQGSRASRANRRAT